MKLLRKVGNYFRQSRQVKQQKWLKKRISQKLQLDEKQQLELQQLITQAMDSKQSLKQCLNPQELLTWFEDEKFDPVKAKQNINTTLSVEFEKMVDIFAEFYQQLQLTQKQQLQQLLSSKNHCGCCKPC